MHALLTPLPTRAAPGRVAHRPWPSPATFPRAWVASLLLASVSVLPTLAFLNARGLATSASAVGLCEGVLFAWCVVLQMRRLPPWTVALCLGLLSWMVLTWLLRQRMDLKSVRDLLIPLLFISLGRTVADSAFAERCLRNITCLVLAVALLEAAFTTAYGELFNTFSFYAGIGSIRESSAMFAGQTLTLNGFRPEGIGRTMLPALLGAHRASSVFLEPVSLGNFAVIVWAWYLSRTWNAWSRETWAMCLVAGMLVVLSDSRFGMLMVGLLLLHRMLPVPTLRWVAILYPFALLAGIVGVAWFLPKQGDNLLGRISASGQALLRFDEASILGLSSSMPLYGDMGYAYVLSRFGAVVVLLLLALILLLPMASERAERFRAFIVLYLFSSLAISGTSVFALKTAGLMWFLLGALSADPGLAASNFKRSKP